MLMEEFEERTGFHVPGEFFDVIHEVYMETDMDKDKFCNAYKKNKDGLAEKIKMQYIRKRTKEQVSICKKLEKEQSKVNQLESQVEHLKKDLEREQEWAPFVDEKAVSNEQYDQLTTFGEQISDEYAKKIVSEYFGFDENKLCIYREKPVYEINRHHQLRQVGVVKRDPYCHASDWNYIYFSCMGINYEIFNDTLHPYI